MVEDPMNYAKNVNLVKFMQTLFINLWSPCILPLLYSAPLNAEGLDVVGLITLKSSRGHAYILVVVDYISKWAEVVPLKEEKKGIVVNFIQANIIYWHNIP